MKRNYNNILALYFFSLVSIIIYFKLYSYQDYIQWGNFGFPLQSGLLSAITHITITWDPYLNNGAMITTPWISIFSYLNLFMLIVFGGIWSINIAIKIYLTFSLVFYAYSFYCLSGRFVTSYPARLLSTNFFLVNPLSLQLIGDGDPFQFILFGFLSLSIFYLSKAIQDRDRNYLLFVTISLIFLSFTIGQPQIFYLGVPLYILFLALFEMSNPLTKIARRALNFILHASILILILAILSLPLILTTLFGAVNFSPNSPAVNGLLNFEAYSVTPWNLLTMNSNLLQPISILINNISSTILKQLWLFAVSGISLIFLETGFILREKRILFLTSIILFTAMIGSGYLSPLNSITVYLYEHAYGYQVLNASYYWEWIIIIPLYSIICAILFDFLFHRIRISLPRKTLRIKSLLRFLNESSFKGNLYFVVAIIIFLILIFVSFLPVYSGNYYGNSNLGIHYGKVPQSYNSMLPNLEKFIGKSDVGVAFFPGTNYVYFGNTTNASLQPLMLNSPIRFPMVAGSQADNEYSFYFTWAYYEFYANNTRNIAELFGLGGIKYFVTLNDVYPVAGYMDFMDRNATELMEFQKNIVKIYTNQDYSIFESTLNVTVGNSINAFSIFSGDYGSLLAAASDGVNLINLAPIYPGDITSKNFDFVLNRTLNFVIAPESLTSLAIDKYTNQSTSIDILNYTSNYLSPYQAWVNSQSLFYTDEPYIISNPFSYAVTYSSQSINVSKIVPSNGTYDLWAYVLNSPMSASSLTIRVDNISLNLNTGNSDNPGNFTWIKVPFYANSNKVRIEFTAEGGINGVERLAILKPGLVSNEIQSLDKLLKEPKINYLNLILPYSNVSSVKELPIHIVQNLNYTQSYDQHLIIPVSFLNGLNNSRFSNILFKYNNGQNIYAWIQSFNQTALDVWLKVGIQSRNETIYLAIYNKSEDFFNDYGYLGEAPTLSPIYNQYNNAREVFPYSLFFTNITDAQKLLFSRDTNYKISDGLTIYGGPNYNRTFIPTSFSPYEYGLIYDAYFSNSTLNYNPGSLLSFSQGGIQYDGLTYFSGHYYINMKGEVDGSYYNYLSSPIPMSNSTFNIFYETISNNQTQIDYKDKTYFENITAGVNLSRSGNIGLFELNQTLHVRYVIVIKKPAGGMPMTGFAPIESRHLINTYYLVTKINNSSGIEKLLFISNNPNGYVISGSLGNINLIRFEYYPGVYSKGVQVIPIMDGINYILVLNENYKQVSFSSYDYSLLTSGFIAYLFIVIAMISIYYYLLRKSKRKRL